MPWGNDFGIIAKVEWASSLYPSAHSLNADLPVARGIQAGCLCYNSRRRVAGSLGSFVHRFLTMQTAFNQQRSKIEYEYEFEGRLRKEKARHRCISGAEEVQSRLRLDYF